MAKKSTKRPTKGAMLTLRLSPQLRDDLASSAEKAERSLSQEVVLRLEESLTRVESVVLTPKPVFREPQ